MVKLYSGEYCKKPNFCSVLSQSSSEHFQSCSLRVSNTHRPVPGNSQPFPKNTHPDLPPPPHPKFLLGIFIKLTCAIYVSFHSRWKITHSFLWKCSRSVTSNSVTQWTAAHQAPLSMEFSRQEYRSGLLCHPLGNLRNLGIERTSFISSALAGGFFWATTTSATMGTHIIFSMIL